MNNKWALMIFVVGFQLVSLAANAAVVVCGNTHRTFSMSNASVCQVGNGNPLVGDINAAFPTTGGWQRVGGIDAGAPTNSLFSIQFTSGGFGQRDSSGSLTLSSNLWQQYADVVLSFHVGNGTVVAPDYFAFLMLPSTTGAQWVYDWRSGNGGGFSNFHVWGSGVPHIVPESASAVLFALGLLGLSGLRRKTC